MYNITVVGTGYVGLSNAMLFSKQHQVIALDIDASRVEKLKQKQLPIKDELIEQYLQQAQNFQVTLDANIAYKNADVIIIATPTNYDEKQNYFDTSSIEKVISYLNMLKTKAIIVIKSTIPVGFTARIQSEFPALSIIFSPEFLREGKALFDNLYPSRIVVGDTSEKGQLIGELFKSSALKDDVDILRMDSTEAEAVKLFSNTYLAMRVAYFNELDTYCALRDLNSKDIIQAVGLDPRIGSHYNNPSFGYGGYCLPKDTKQLLANYKDVPQNLIQAIIHSNRTRKQFIVKEILKKRPDIVGIYRLTMKAGSDNFRDSAIQDIIRELEEYNVKVQIYEPTLQQETFETYAIKNDLNEFLSGSDVILANRMHRDLEEHQFKLYTRDLFREN